jgi:hypothetical protein
MHRSLASKQIYATKFMKILTTCILGICLIAAAYFIYNRQTTPDLRPLPVDQYLNQPTSLNGQNHRIEAQVISQMENNALAKLLKVRLIHESDSSEFLPIIVPHALGLDLFPGQKMAFNVNILNQNIIVTDAKKL